MLASIGTWCLLSYTVFATNPQNDLVSAIHTACEANRAALSFGRARFQFSTGPAPGVLAAQRGDWTDRSTAQGFYVFDGPAARYECVYSPKDLASHTTKTGEHEFTSTLSSRRLLTNGAETLGDAITVDITKEPRHTADIRPGADQFFKSVLFPLALGNPDPESFQLLRDTTMSAHAQAGGMTLAVVNDHAKSEGIEVVQLAFTMEGNRRDYWIDIERGAIPIQIRDTQADGGLVAQIN